jgi:hypothetical protein
MVYGLVFFAILMSGMFMFGNIVATYAYIVTASTLNIDNINTLLNVQPYIHIANGPAAMPGHMMTDNAGVPLSFVYRKINSGVYATEFCTEGNCHVNGGKEFKVHTNADIV